MAAVSGVGGACSNLENGPGTDGIWQAHLSWPRRNGIRLHVREYILRDVNIVLCPRVACFTFPRIFERFGRLVDKLDL